MSEMNDFRDKIAFAIAAAVTAVVFVGGALVVLAAVALSLWGL